MIRLLREEKARRGLQDLYFFCKFILGYDDVELEPHYEMCEFLNHPWKKKLDLEPRGCFKSTVGTIGRTIQKIIQNPNIRILINSQDLANAKKFLAEIKGHFEQNQELRSLYGDYVGTKWNDNEIIVSKRSVHRKEPTIATGGIETPRTGLHFDLIINDDLHSEHNVNTPEQIQKVIDFWKFQAAILEPDGEELTIGTRWLVGDLYEEIMNIEKQRRKEGLGKEYLIRKRSAIYPDGRLHFPTRLTREFLESQKLKLGTSFFARQYLNDPVDEGATLFKKKWMKFYGRTENLPKNLVVTAVLDPAISEKDDQCDSFFTVVGTDEDGYSYLLAAYAMKAPTNEVIDRIFWIQDVHNPGIFGIEGVAFQKSLKYWVWERMRQTGKRVNIFELKTDTRVTKDMRIKALVPYFESGSWAFPGKSSKDLNGDMLKLWEQVVTYPMSKFVDGIDSLAYHLQIIIPPAAQVMKAQKPKGLTFFEERELERKQRVGNKYDSKLPLLGQRRRIYHNAFQRVA